MIEIVAREGWHARLPRTESPLITPIKHVFWMNAPRDMCMNRRDCNHLLRHMQEFHMNVQNQRDIRPNFLVGGDGSLYEGRGWYTSPLLPINLSSFQNDSIIIGFIGEYSGTDVPDVMAFAAHNLIDYGMAEGVVAQDHELHNIMLRGQRLRNQPPGFGDPRGMPVSESY